MSDDRDINALAGEYVLGTLSAEERNFVATRMARDPQLTEAVLYWERRLAPLALQTPSVAPPPSVLKEIKTRIASHDHRAQSKNNVISLERSRRRWRLAAASMAALAASLAGFIVMREMTIATQPTTFVAVLQKDSMSPAFILSVNTKTRMLSVHPVDAKHEPGKSFELWLVHKSLQGPRSLGLLSDKSPLTTSMLLKYNKAVFMDATYAVSVEPEGGSTTGAPTGPVVFAGKLLPDAL